MSASEMGSGPSMPTLDPHRTGPPGSGSRTSSPRASGKDKPRATAWPRKNEREQWPRGRELRGREERKSPDGPVILYGWHTVKAALENPARRIRRLLATENALRRLNEDAVVLGVTPH